MMESLVDYVLERGHRDYGQFAPKENTDPSNSLYNHRKLLAYLFQEDTNSQINSQQKLERRISDLKLEEIAGQLNYFSQKIHAELSKKHLILDGDLYRMQNQWLRKKMPDFYCYYFLKFSYANSYSRMHEIFLSEIENMTKEKDTYTIMKKTIEARQSCLSNLRKLIMSIKQLQIEESLHTLREERQTKRKAQVTKNHGNFKQKERGEQSGKSWKNQLEVVFQNISHLRKLTAYVVQLIKMWRTSIYNISDDPRRFRERVIFYYNDSNYLLKMLFDGNFVKDSILKKYMEFNQNFDPFFLKPAMNLQLKKSRSQEEDIFLELIKPTEIDMDKITKALVALAEEEYDEDQQSRFINERKNYGELENRKMFIERRRDTLGLRKNESEKVLPNKPFTSRDSRQEKQNQKESLLSNDKEKSSKLKNFSNDKRAQNTQRQLQEIKAQKEEGGKKSRVQTSLNRLKLMRSVDLKKLSPYLSRNERIEKAQKVIQLQHKFRVAQSDYVESLKKKKQEQLKDKVKNAIDTNKETINNKIFNRYIEENLKLMDEATKKMYLFKNPVQVNRQKVASSLNYNKVPFHHRKQAEYQRNLQKYYPKEQISPSPNQNKERAQSRTKGTKAVIEISNKGVRSNEKIIEFQLTNKKGKNLGQILNTREKEINKQQTINKLQGYQQIDNKQKQSGKDLNLFESEKQSQLLIIRQEPQKLQEIKQFLYIKIKEELIQQMKKNAENKEIQMNNMIEEEKRRKIQEIMEERRLEEQRRRQQQQRQRIAKLQRQRKQLGFDIRIDPIQYAEQNVSIFFDKVFGVEQTTYHRLFTAQKIQDLKDSISQQFYYISLIGYYENAQVAYCIAHFDWQHQLHRKLVIDYLSLKQNHLYMSSLYQVTEYLWTHDPCQEIQMVFFNNGQNKEGLKIIEDVETYAQKTGQVFEKQIYSNVAEMRFVWTRPQHHANLEFPFTNYYFGKLFHFKSELLSASISLSERHQPKIDMTLEMFTNYIFLLEQLFRSYLTPEEVVQLRENSMNIRRLKDIFRVVLDLQKTNPIVDQLTVVEGINLDDLYSKLKEKKESPYQRYYWHHFYDKTSSNRLLLSMLQMKPQLKYNMQSCRLDDRRFLRINCRQKILVLRSSVYPGQNIYVLDTNIPKIKMFLADGQHFKLMRIELFIFLNLLFNNLVEDEQRYVNSIWMPQLTVSDGNNGKQVQRITDFSISMKKSFFLAEEIYLANHEYIKNAVSLLPKPSDVLFRESVILGLLHTEIEKASTGMPLYAKLVDKGEMFSV